MNPTREELQLDALREICNVGAGHAAQALSRLTGGHRVSMDIPRAMRMDALRLAELLGGRTVPVVAASFDMTGALHGRLIVVWPQSDAEKLGRWLARQAKQGDSAEVAASALSEAANIVASACLSAVGQLAGLNLIPSVPTIEHSTAEQVAKMAIANAGGTDGQGLVLEARMHSPEMSNELLLVPDAASTAALLAKLGI